MLFSINYSTQAAALLDSGRIQVDRFKCPEWPELVAEALRLRPVAVHFKLRTGDKKLAEADWDGIASLVEMTNTPYINLHLNPKQEDFPNIPAGTADPALFDQVLDRMLADVSLLTRHFGAERVIVENVPYRGPQGETLRAAVIPYAIQEIIRTTGCGLLLDISHARIAAHHLGMDARDYMNQLPAERLCELHFTGLHTINGRLVDHLGAQESDWPVLAWALERIRAGEWSRPWMLAFEYGGVGAKFAWRSDAQVISQQAPRLYQLVQKI